MEIPVRKAEFSGKAAQPKKPRKRTIMRQRKRGRSTQKIISGTALAKSGEVGTCYSPASDVNLQDALASRTTFLPPAAPSDLLPDRNQFAVTLPA